MTNSKAHANSDTASNPAPNPAEPQVDFGFEKVSPSEKTRRVGGVFSSVANRYDVMNDLMSFGTHRLMKRMLMEMSGLRAGDTHLDLAGGTGDIAALASPIVGDTGQVVLADINAEMLEEGGDLWAYEEGCLSIPDIRGDVKRHKKIKIKYYDENFDEHIETYDDINARVIQHE